MTRARLFLVGVLLIAGCEKASRYPAVTVVSSPKSEAKADEPGVATNLGWLPTSPRPDVPIEFIAAESHPETWKKLPRFWNDFATSYMLPWGQPPWGALTALVAVREHQVVQIKVPLGLPDPTPNIPTSNAPTLGKWLLGKRLFFDGKWLTKEGGFACATCHNPNIGFTKYSQPSGRFRNPPSLINCVYNKHQFWDGRATALEQVLQRQLSDEVKSSKMTDRQSNPLYTHVFPGIVYRLRGRADYRKQFAQVFGLEHETVTADAVAKALATYMRTIMSGNSLYDQAKQRAEADGKKLPTDKHYEALLTENVMRHLNRENDNKKSVAYHLEHGQRLFFAKETRCVLCHGGWNFTDHGFHNISIRESDHHILMKEKWANPKYGRFGHLPIGLKDKTMIGAFKTPSLRNLPRTPPYFHSGQTFQLEDTVLWYNRDIHKRDNEHLDARLKNNAGHTVRLKLQPAEVADVALFLRALDGDAVPTVITVRPTRP